MKKVKNVVAGMLLVSLAVLIGYVDYCIFIGHEMTNKEFVSTLGSMGFVGFLLVCLCSEEIFK